MGTTRVARPAATRTQVERGLAQLEDRFTYDASATLQAAGALAEQAEELGDTGLWMRARLVTANL